MQNTWQGQEFVRVAKGMAGVVDLKRVRNDAFRVVGAGISWFVMSMFEASDAESAEGCKFHVTEMLLCGDHFAWQLQEFVCLRPTCLWQAQYFWSVHFKIAKMFCNSEAKCLVHMSFLKEVSQKCFGFDLQSLIFEGRLAEMLRFWASKFQFWRKSRRKKLRCCWHVHVSPAWHLTLAGRFLIAVLRCVSKTAQSVSQSNSQLVS